MNIRYLHIKEIKEGKNIFAEPENYRQILVDISKRGIQVPVLVDAENTLIDGYTRLKCAKKLGIEFIPAIVLDGKRDIEEISIVSNVMRRHLKPGQIVEMIVRLSEIEEKRAKERQIQAGKLGRLGGRGIAKDSGEYQEKTLGLNQAKGFDFDADGAGRTAEKVGETLGVSRDTAGKVIQIAKKAPELIERVKRGDMSINAAYTQLREKENKLKEQLTPMWNDVRKIKKLLNDPRHLTENTISEVLLNMLDVLEHVLSGADLPDHDRNKLVARIHDLSEKFRMPAELYDTNI